MIECVVKGAKDRRMVRVTADPAVISSEVTKEFNGMTLGKPPNTTHPPPPPGGCALRMPGGNLDGCLDLCCHHSYSLLQWSTKAGLAAGPLLLSQGTPQARHV